MTKKFLAAAAVLSLGACASPAGPISQYTYAQRTDGASAPAPEYFPVSALRHFGPNPWDGTESWAQYNRDHPAQGGDGG
jgi:hypothetical protein